MSLPEGALPPERLPGEGVPRIPKAHRMQIRVDRTIRGWVAFQAITLAVGIVLTPASFALRPHVPENAANVMLGLGFVGLAGPPICLMLAIALYPGLLSIRLPRKQRPPVASIPTQRRR